MQRTRTGMPGHHVSAGRTSRGRYRFLSFGRTSSVRSSKVRWGVEYCLMGAIMLVARVSALPAAANGAAKKIHYSNKSAPTIPLSCVLIRGVSKNSAAVLACTRPRACTRSVIVAHTHPDHIMLNRFSVVTYCMCPGILFHGWSRAKFSGGPGEAPKTARTPMPQTGESKLAEGDKATSLHTSSMPWARPCWATSRDRLFTLARTKRIHSASCPHPNLLFLCQLCAVLLGSVHYQDSENKTASVQSETFSRHGVSMDGSILPVTVHKHSQRALYRPRS